jgi:hypothetical protein
MYDLQNVMGVHPAIPNWMPEAPQGTNVTYLDDHKGWPINCDVTDMNCVPIYTQKYDQLKM